MIKNKQRLHYINHKWKRSKELLKYILKQKVLFNNLDLS